MSQGAPDLVATTTGHYVVPFDDLRIGELLAEGGEGRVFELPLRPHLVFKAFRRPAPPEFLVELVAWRHSLGSAEMAARVQASTSWPEAVVAGPDGSSVGLLLPRAPRRFALRHRDGTTRLASLSYLTADPAHRALAYGLHLPPEVSPERIGLVYSFARLLEAFESGDTRIGHGDLSTKNVLWSLERGPETFVIDCDNCERFAPTGDALGPAARRRAMTPNWEDPAVGNGGNPTIWSDRYSLALIFLRVVGGANFPIQARQRGGEAVTVHFAMPSTRNACALLAPSAPVWDLCERGLSVVAPDSRPSPAQWLGALEALLDALGASGIIRSVWAAQGGGAPRAADCPPSDHGPRDVHIQPVPGLVRPQPRRQKLGPQAATTGSFGFQARGSPSPPMPSPAVANPRTPVFPQLVAGLRKGFAWWLSTHRRTMQTLSSGHPGDGLRSLAFCALVDVAACIGGLFVVAMVVAPILGI